MGARTPLDRIAMAGAVYRRPGSHRPVPTHAAIADVLRRGPVHLTQGEVDELADTLAYFLRPQP
ncbi:MAG TPA: hypothetical protein VK507_19155 [Iamia sp.]|nr:hypothetical protein [Iamia sp.]